MSLRDIRTAKGITQEDLEASSGVTQTTISSIERGTNKRPSWETVRRLAIALNVAPDELFPADCGDVVASQDDVESERRSGERRTADRREAR